MSQIRVRKESSRKTTKICICRRTRPNCQINRPRFGDSNLPEYHLPIYLGTFPLKLPQFRVYDRET